MQPRKKFESAYENLDKYVFFLVSNIFFSDIRGPRYLPLKKVYSFPGHPLVVFVVMYSVLL